MKFVVVTLVDGVPTYSVEEADTPAQAVLKEGGNMWDVENVLRLQNHTIEIVGTYEVGQTNLLELIADKQEVHTFYQKKLEELGYNPFTFEKLKDSFARFDYESNIDATNLNMAESKFLEEAWGVYLADYLRKEMGSFTPGETEVVETVAREERKSEGYVHEVSRLDNGLTMSYSIWENEVEYPEEIADGEYYFGRLTVRGTRKEVQ